MCDVVLVVANIVLPLSVSTEFGEAGQAKWCTRLSWAWTAITSASKAELFNCEASA